MAITGLILIITHHFLGSLATIAVVFGGLLIAFSHFQKLYLIRFVRKADSHAH